MLPEMAHLKQTKKFDFTHREVNVSLVSGVEVRGVIRHTNENGFFMDSSEPNIVFYPWTSVSYISYKI